jgi:hypothetical protein
MAKITGFSALFAFLLIFLCAASPAWSQQPQQYHYVMGAITQISQGSIQIRDNMGMTSTVTVTPQTIVFSCAKDPKTVQPSPLSELRQGDMVLVACTPQGGGVFLASMIGFLHQGETMHPGWGQGGQSSTGSSPGYTPGTGTTPGNNPGSTCPPSSGSTYPGSGTTPGYTPGTGTTPGYNPGSACPPSSGSTYPGAGTTPGYTPGTGYGSPSTGSSVPGSGTSPGYTPGAGTYPGYTPGTGAGTAVTDPNGHFSFTLPAGWAAAGTQQGAQMFMKQGPQGAGGCMAGSQALPPAYQQSDIMTIAQGIAQNYAAQGTQYGYQQLGLSPVSFGGLSGACLKFSFKYPNGQDSLVEEYYFRTAQAGITLHFESTPQSFETYRADIQQILQSLQIK